jgi:hypothetical protein
MSSYVNLHDNNFNHPKKNHTDLLGTGNIKENMPNSKELSKQMFSPDRL